MLRWLRRLFGAPLGVHAQAEALYREGEALALRGEHAAAEALFRRALARDPSRASYHYALGCALQATGRHGPAVECYRRAMALDARLVPAMINLGSILQASGERGGDGARRLEEALALFRAATELAPGAPDGWINLGFALERSRRLAESRHAYDRALAIDPSLADARFNRSLVLLAQGDFAAGWEDYEARWQATGYPRPAFGGPEWDGRALGGKTVFVYAEQGFGDAIQCARYLPLLEARGGRALLRCQPELERLFAGLRGVAGFVAPDAVPGFDFHCSLLSLPRLFGTRVETIPAEVPYLHADPALVARWRARLNAQGSALRVGLAWSSRSSMPDAAVKSLPPEALAPLGVLSGVRFYSLQLGEAATQLRMEDFTGEIGDFADTAALMECLDLVITVDTAVAHLAGALARPVWTLLRYAPDWRWYPDAARSLWYPTMRLYRQQAPGEWGGVVAAVARELVEAAAGERGAAPRATWST